MKKRILPFLMFTLIATMGFAQTHTLLVTVPDSIVSVFVAGEFNNWNPATDSMNVVAGSPGMFSFEYTFDGDIDSMEYKFLAGPDWKYEQKQAANFMAKNDSATAVVDTFKAVWHRDQEKDVVIDVLVPVEVYQLNVTGTFNGWDPAANPMEMIDSSSNGKEFTATIHTLDTTTLQFKFVAGPGWPYEQTNAANYNYMTDGGTVVCDEFKKIFNPNAVGDITVHITSVPEGTPAVFIIGSWGGSWQTTEAIEATKNEDDTYTAVVHDVADIDFKVYNYPDWAYEEASDATGTSVADRHASVADSPVEITVAFWKAVHTATGVKDPVSAAYKMYTINQTIVVEGVTSTVTVFDVNGRLMQNARAKGIFVSKTLQPGIYILRVDNKVQKVAVQ